MSRAKPVISFFDVHTSDQEYYRTALEPDYKLKFTDAALSSETIESARDAQVISVHVSSHVTAVLMRLVPDLHHIACRTTGYDNVDMAYAKTHNISVSTVPAYGEDTVAEYAFLLLLAVSRRLMRAAHSVHAGHSNPEKLTGNDLHSKTLGIVGTGRIGRSAARIGRGFGMNVLAYDPFPNNAASTEIGYEYVKLDQLLKAADYITLHAPSTPETHHMLDSRAFSKMKSGVFIVNTARGNLIDTAALIEALTSGKVGGAGLDVLEGEEHLEFAAEVQLLNETTIDDQAKSLLSIDILTKMPNVLITAHNAYNSAEALGRIRQKTIENILSWESGSARNLVA
ncbi:MAG TPA: NAD(P)-dependent oxidoreductase [Candidatus Saccharimonadia bacterium]|nr:NAD(P)-dependent oxidoreductase [Candidatus Saccharimonadia bacterium]